MTESSETSFFANHPNAAYECSNTRALSSDSDDPDLRNDVFPYGGHGYCTRDKSLARCGSIDGAAQWERAKDPCADDSSYSSGADSGPDAVGSNEDADDAGGSDEDDDGAAGSHENADHAAGSVAAVDGAGESANYPHTFGAAPAGASDARNAVALGGAPAASSVPAPAPDLPSLLAGFLARVLASGSALVSSPDLPGLFADVLARLIALESPAASLPPQPDTCCGCPGAWCRRG